jgi:hypothetical protein
VYDWARRGLLPGVIRIAGTLRFDSDILEEFLRDGGDKSQKHSGRSDTGQILHPI